MSDSVRPHRLQPTRLRRPWDSPGKNTGVGCHFLLQCIKVKSESEVAQSCPTLSNPVDCSLPGSSVHGIFQARVLDWGAIAFSSYTVHEVSKTQTPYRVVLGRHYHMFPAEAAVGPGLLNWKDLALHCLAAWAYEPSYTHRHIHTHTHFHTGPSRLPPSTVSPTLASRGMHSWHSELEFLEGVFSGTSRVHQESPRALTLTHTG